MNDLLANAYRALDLATPLDKAQPWYVERPGDPIGLLRLELQLSSSPTRAILAGQRGVGKSTELLRLRSPDDTWVTLAPGGADSNEWLAGRLIHTLKFGAAAGDLPDVLPVTGVLLIDGLEKAPPAAVVGLLDALRLVPEQRVVCVVPIDLVLDPTYAEGLADWTQVIVPALPVVRRDGKVEPTVTQVLGEVLARRIGDASVLGAGVLDFLVKNSGGIHRELLGLAQRAVLRAIQRGLRVVDVDCAVAAVQQRRQDLSYALTVQDFDFLSELERTQRLRADPRTISLIRRNLLVSYSDEWTWFRPNPILEPMLAPA